MPVRIWALIVCAVLGGTGMPSAAADFGTELQPGDTLTAVAGGPGGDRYVLRCDPGTYLMGIGARFGAWIDYAEPYCASVRPDGGSFLREIGGGQFTGDGAGNIGQPYGASARCRDLEYIAFALFPTRVVTRDGGQFLGHFGVGCRRMVPAFEQEPGSYHHDIHLTTPAGDANYVPLGAIACDTGQWAVGIHGGAGLYVDSMGLICAAAPAVAVPVPDVAQPLPDWLRDGTAIITAPDSPVAEPLPDWLEEGAGVITCVACPQTQVFAPPMLEGYAVDICLTWAENCGQPAADAFCAVGGYATAAAYEYQYDSPPTRIISTGEICDEDYCTRFASITCQR